MSYQRKDRKDTETRPIEVKAGVIKRADGSAMFKIGNTVALAAVYGPREMYPRFQQDPQKGVLRVKYNMMPFSGSGDRIRPGGSRRSKEISMVTANALLPVVDLDAFPNAVVDVFIEFPSTDAGTRCAGICAAAVALADAGIAMRDLVSSVSVGKIGDKLLVDLDYSEESYPDADVADIPIAVIPRTGEVTLMQMDGFANPEDVPKAAEMALEACKKIHDAQTKALKDSIGGAK